MIPRILAYLLGPSWQITLVGFGLGLLDGLQAAPGIVSGHPTVDDWMRLAKGTLLSILGRMASQYHPPSPNTSPPIVPVTLAASPREPESKPEEEAHSHV